MTLVVGVKVVVGQHARQGHDRFNRVILRSGHSGERLPVQRESEWRIPDDTVSQHRNLVDNDFVLLRVILLCRHGLADSDRHQRHG